MLVLWSMAGAACLMMAAFYTLLWIQTRQKLYLWSTLSASAAALNVWCEVGVFQARSIAEAYRFLLLENVAIAVLSISLAWFVRAYLPGARRAGALLFTGAWLVGMIMNFRSSGTLVFVEITALEQGVAWGQTYMRPVGPVNPWTLLVNLANLFFLAYVVDASVQSVRRGERRRAMVVGGGTVLFMTTGTVHSVLVDYGLIESPYMVAFAYLFIIATMSIELTRDVVKAAQVERELHATRIELAKIASIQTAGELTTTLSHELRQPLGALTFNAEAAVALIERDQNKQTELAEAIKAILSDCQRAQGIVERVCKLFNQGTFERESVEVSTLLADVLSLAQTELRRLQVRTQVDVEPDLPEIFIGRIELQLVIMNLLKNAMDAMKEVKPEHRQIKIVARRSPAGVQVSVHDHGPGLAQEAQDNLFRMQSSPKPGGLGVGLSICKRLIEAHGGTIWAGRDEMQGPGACFGFSLPLSNP